MNKRIKSVIERMFGRIKKTERIRTQLLFVRPYGTITVPEIDLGGVLQLCCVRVPDDAFFEGSYWANYGPKPSDDDPNVFIAPVFLRPYARPCLDSYCWQCVTYGDFLTTESGVVILDAPNIFAWEGYERPKTKIDYNFDRRRLEKSQAALMALVQKTE